MELDFLPIYFYLIMLSTIVSFRAFTPAFAAYPYLRAFPPFLLATMLVEFTAAYIRSRNQSNLLYYNFFTVVEFCFYLWILSYMVENKKAKNIFRITSAAYLVIALGNIIFIQGINSFHTITYSLGCLLVVGACIYYFLELFRLPKSIQLAQSPPFWICSGLLFFYCCGFPLYAFLNYWATVRWVIESLASILITLNTFLYALFTIAFLWVKTPKYTQSSL